MKNFLLTILLFGLQSLYADGYGFVWGDRPTTASYTPSALYSFNSKGSLLITRLGVGNYKVRFNGFTPSEGRYGHLQVTSYGGNNSNCQVQSWSVSSYLDAYIKCFNYAGVAKDEYFTLLAIIPQSIHSPFAYVWANNPASPSYVPSTPYSYNPSGGGILIQRMALGQYKVIFRNLKSKMFKGGNVEVSPYGSNFSYCKVQGWSISDPDVTIAVNCFNRFGQAQDNQFLTYMLWGSPYPFFSSYAWAHNATSPSYTPSDFYAVPGGTVIERMAVGSYRVKLKGVGHYQPDDYQTSVQITPYGTTNHHCKVKGWKRAEPGSATDTMDVFVDCYYPNSDSKVDSQFDILALYPYQLI